MNTNKKSSKLVWIIMVILLVLVGVYVYSKNNLKTDTDAGMAREDASNMQTYSNEEFGFQFQYPQDVEVNAGTHYGGGIQDAGEVQFAVSFPSRITDGPPGFEIFIFSVKPNSFKTNEDLAASKKNMIAVNPNVKDKWNVGQIEFFNMGKAVVISEGDASVCANTLSESVFVVRSPYLYTFNDYRCSPQWVKDIVKTFTFTK
jgi:hypothetical protein